MKNDESNHGNEAFDQEAKAKAPTFLVELWLFLKGHKKWWLLPVIIVFVVFGILILLSATGAAPFIYTFF
jgi:Family of unknown function (DUF5989)